MSEMQGADGHRLAAPALAEEFARIDAEAARRGLLLRAFGSVAFYLHLEDRDLLGQLRVDPLNDLDLVGLSEQRSDYKKLFKELGYEVNQNVLVSTEGKRFLFENVGVPEVGVDLFIDRLEMCHRIELRDRLRIQPRTLPLCDLLLQKLQIVELNRKDVVDVAGLLAEHELNGEGSETVDLEYFARVLGDNWGFFYTVKLNLARVREFVADKGAVLTEVTGRLDRLERAIDDAPKSRRWKLRAKVGTRKKWYQDVDKGAEAF
jgi:hypothetical protein